MVEVNGRQIPMLATVFNPIEGKSKEVMEKTLRSEAAKRIFGVGTGLKRCDQGYEFRNGKIVNRF